MAVVSQDWSEFVDRLTHNYGAAYDPKRNQELRRSSSAAHGELADVEREDLVAALDKVLRRTRSFLTGTSSSARLLLAAGIVDEAHEQPRLRRKHDAPAHGRPSHVSTGGRPLLEETDARLDLLCGTGIGTGSRQCTGRVATTVATRFTVAGPCPDRMDKHGSARVRRGQKARVARSPAIDSNRSTTSKFHWRPNSGRRRWLCTGRAHRRARPSLHEGV